MARQSTALSRVPAGYVLRPKPRPRQAGALLMVPRAAGGLARRAGAKGLTIAKKLAMAQKHTLTAVGAAAVAGYLARDGSLQKLPHLRGVGPVTTYGLAALLAAHYSKSQTLAHVATGLLSVAAYEMAKNPGKGLLSDGVDTTSSPFHEATQQDNAATTAAGFDSVAW